MNVKLLVTRFYIYMKYKDMNNIVKLMIERRPDDYEINAIVEKSITLFEEMMGFLENIKMNESYKLLFFNLYLLFPRITNFN
jgi:hypothetical protein